MPKGQYNRSVRPVQLVIGPSIAYCPLTQGQWSVFDVADLPLVACWNWQAQWCGDTQSFYAVRHKQGTNSGQIRMHEDLFGGMCDHLRPPDTLDNRRANLRLCNRSQNAANKRRGKPNKLGRRGVYETATGLTVQIRVNGKLHRVGKFAKNELDLASAAYADAARRFFGEFARTTLE